MAWLDVAEAAAQLDVDARQVRRLLAGGDLAGQRIGRVWIVDADSVRERLRQNPVAGRPLAIATASGKFASIATDMQPEPVPISQNRAFSTFCSSAIAASTSVSVSGLGIRTSGVTSKSRP